MIQKKDEEEEGRTKLELWSLVKWGRPDPVHAEARRLLGGEEEEDWKRIEAGWIWLAGAVGFRSTFGGQCWVRSRRTPAC